MGMERPPKALYSREVAELPKTPEAFIRSFDFNTLDDILSTLQRRSGVTDVRPVQRKVMFGVLTPEDRARFRNARLSGRTVIGDADAETGRVRIKWDDEYPFEESVLESLKVLIHEEIHMVSDQNVVREKRLFGKGKIIEKKSGFKEDSLQENGNYRVSGWNFNEGVTEELAGQVLVEYLRRKGDSNWLRSLEGASVGSWTYESERADVKAVVKLLAKQLGGPSEDEIWLGITTLYFSGGPSFNEFNQMVTDALSGAAEEGFHIEKAFGSDLLTESERSEISARVFSATDLDTFRSMLRLEA